MFVGSVKPPIGNGISVLSTTLIGLLLCLQGAVALQILMLSADVPSEVALGSDAVLQCTYDLQGQKLYSLKWYKGQHEFYRYVPKERPPIQIFAWSQFFIRPGDPSVAGRVILSNVTADAEGTYKCEVSIEAPTFYTDSTESNMSVIDVGSGEPTIEAVKDATGALRLKCSFNRTRPASHLEWLVNGKKTSTQSAMRLEPVGDAHLGGGVWNAMLELRVSPAQLVERGGQFEAVCVGRIGRSQNRRALWRFQSLSKQQLLTLLPNGTLDQQFARRTQPVVGAHPGIRDRGGSSRPTTLSWIALFSALLTVYYSFQSPL